MTNLMNWSRRGLVPVVVVRGAIAAFCLVLAQVAVWGWGDPRWNDAQLVVPWALYAGSFTVGCMLIGVVALFQQSLRTMVIPTLKLRLRVMFVSVAGGTSLVVVVWLSMIREFAGSWPHLVAAWALALFGLFIGFGIADRTEGFLRGLVSLWLALSFLEDFEEQLRWLSNNPLSTLALAIGLGVWHYRKSLTNQGLQRRSPLPGQLSKYFGAEQGSTDATKNQLHERVQLERIWPLRSRVRSWDFWVRAASIETGGAVKHSEVFRFGFIGLGIWGVLSLPGMSRIAGNDDPASLAVFCMILFLGVGSVSSPRLAKEHSYPLSRAERAQVAFRTGLIDLGFATVAAVAATVVILALLRRQPDCVYHWLSLYSPFFRAALFAGSLFPISVWWSINARSPSRLEDTVRTTRQVVSVALWAVIALGVAGSGWLLKADSTNDGGWSVTVLVLVFLLSQSLYWFLLRHGFRTRDLRRPSF